ncbi:hypothetical protein DI487_13865 [Flavobacterium sediminis]|uniref:SCO family protein n=1 Tax=Flavobacterium sediminis TaxID=2201181 RepID=A0A2U8QXP1_9FLAO|nr:SCO family protein [Flavobacterium sediminis]AWM14829.1 hypothetical protein DI487_13865 [Flavobacterium sediminis]
MNKIIRTVLTILGVIFVIFLIWYKIDNIPYGENFTLNNEKGKWEFNQNAKEINLLYFGFTSCASVCPMALASVNSSFDMLTQSERKNVSVIFISVDYKKGYSGDSFRIC